MKIKSVKAIWLRVPIPESQQHVSDLGRTTSFDSALVRVETECGLVGHGESKEGVGSVANCHAVVAAINKNFGPALIGEEFDADLKNELIFSAMVLTAFARLFL